MTVELRPPPLTLYVHLPWCVRKCPYCDFNSHALKGDLPADAYIDALLADLAEVMTRAWGRTVQSIYFGGGTPSLFSAAQVDHLLSGIRALAPLAPGAEITLEANPGTVEHDRFEAYRAAGINRVSLGVQSFDDGLLRAIGRIHGRAEVDRALDSLHAAGLTNFNIDLMYGLPGQDLQLAVADLEAAIAAQPAHLSHYQLTLEPNTPFAAAPPELPDEDACWDMQEAAVGFLSGAGFEQYEISAWSRPGMRCRHNLNYWRYGDYLGIGAGAHGKLTDASAGEVRRLSRHRHPRQYLAGSGYAEDRVVAAEDRCFEYFLGTLRLSEGIDPQAFEERTGLPWQAAARGLHKAQQRGLLEAHGERWYKTGLGTRFVNDLQALFLP